MVRGLHIETCSLSMQEYLHLECSGWQLQTPGKVLPVSSSPRFPWLLSRLLIAANDHRARQRKS